MTMSAISHYRGGTIDVVAPVAKKLKAAYLKHGIIYRLSRFETGPNRGDWLVVVQYDQAAHETRFFTDDDANVADGFLSGIQSAHAAYDY